MCNSYIKICVCSFEIKPIEEDKTLVKKVIAILTLAVMTLTFAACSISDSESDAPKEPANLIGEWKQSGGSSSNYQVATITDSTITIYWYSKDDESKSLYWAGSYTAPTTADEPYTWTSQNDTAQTSNALLASSDPTKTFTYENGVIKYEASALGTTTTIKLERVK